MVEWKATTSVANDEENREANGLGKSNPFKIFPCLPALWLSNISRRVPLACLEDLLCMLCFEKSGIQ
jgi:hypothetical protein